MDKSIPRVLWVSVLACGLMAFGKVAAVLSGAPLPVLIDAALTAALLIGLYRGHKWAFVLTLMFVGLGVGIAFRRGPANALGTLLLDCIVLIPVLMSWEYFFPPKSPLPGDE